MNNDNHPITPPEELIHEWESEWHHHRGDDTYEEFMFKQAARWGADMELEACVEWVYQTFTCGVQWSEDLRTARRPKPPSLKEQAKFAAAVLRSPDETCSIAELQQHWHTICNALEQLND